MGLFDVPCALTGMMLSEEARCFWLAKGDKGWSVIALPLRGSYNRLGAIDDIDEGPNHDALLAYAKRLTLPRAAEDGDDLESYLNEMNKGVSEKAWATLGKVPVSFMLVDDRAYRAAIETLQGGGKKGVSVDRKALVAKSFDELAEIVWAGNAALATEIYGSLPAPAKKKLFDELVDLAVFLKWGMPVEPIDLGDSAQLTGYSDEIEADDDEDEDDEDEDDEDDDEDDDIDEDDEDDDVDDGFAKPYNDRARAAFTKFPKILAAIEANADAWRELDADRDDEDD